MTTIKNSTVQHSLTPRLLSLMEISDRTTLRKTKLYELINTGEFTPIKIGRRTVFSEQEVNAWIQDHISPEGKEK
jgi:excisionase family DNA binding protein